MSIHKSLFIGGALATDRSVLTRRERLDRLVTEGRWSEDQDSVYGLPKVRTKFKVLTKKQKKAAVASDKTGTPDGSDGGES
ncbi:MAG: small basic protein [Planctomycetes bacterium]|nr:small basic protein [Planctomycetota bacterium]MBL7007960.1 small basic protein [Planctomycetota bacterium]